MTPARVLVAGVGNLFLSDDGFGPEVARRLAAEGNLPAGVTVSDYGIRGMHLAYDLVGAYDAVVLLDALPDDGEPGRVDVLEVTAEQLERGDFGEFDAHGMNPVAMLAGVEQLGGALPATYVVGCRAATVDEGIGLSEPVAAAVPVALAAVRTLVRRLAGAAPAATRRG